MSFDPWTTEMENDLRRMRRGPDKVPFSTIAETLSKYHGVYVSKNACIGKARRLDMLVTKGPRMKPKPTLPQTPTPPAPGHLARISAPIRPVEAELPAERPAGGITIYQLGRDTCRWPLWVETRLPPLLYCGGKTKGDGVYCREHHARSYNRPSKTWE